MPPSSYKRVLILVFFLGSVTVSIAQDTIPRVPSDSIDYYEMSLEQLLNMKGHGISSELEKLINTLIGAASKKPLSSRESPAIVSLITEEEIKKSGARDLTDVLNLIPGFDFGVDVEGVVGMATRGLWSHEGKILLLIDGQEMNEMLFATNQMGNHCPVDQIKKVEVIRGPGSAIYGGFAEYGVINIITKSGEDINGLSVAASYGQTESTYARRNVQLSIGKKYNKFSYSLSAFTGQGKRSDKTFTDFYGTSIDLKNNSALDLNHINVGFTFKELSFRGIYDGYNTTVSDGYDKVNLNPYKEKFTSAFSELKYNYKPNDKWIITPRFSYKKQIPWQTEGDDSTEGYYKVADRTLGNLNVSYNITRKINLIAGAEAYQDFAKDLSDSGTFVNEKNKISYFNQAYYLQGLLKHRIVNLIVGGRFDHNSAYGSAFVPRLGLTKKIKKTHFKFLYSNAFRAPSIENINYQTDAGIKSEKTRVLELEAGQQLTRNSLLTVNLYDIDTKDPIVYVVDSITFLDSYINSGRSGSRGVEAEFRIKEKWGYFFTNYAFYTVAGKEKVEDYTVEDNESILLAFPAHKINFSGSFKLYKGLSVNPSFLFRSSRYAYTSVDDSGSSVMEQLPASYYFNLYFYAEDVFTKGLNIGFGVFNLFNEQIKYVQPYNGYHAPLPGLSREFIIRINYNFQSKKKEAKQ